jgi:hypothetical protein
LTSGPGLRELALGPNDVYFTELTSSSAGPIQGNVHRMPKQGGPAQVVFSGNNPMAIASDESAAYFSASPDSVEPYPTTLWKVGHDEDDAHPIVKHSSFIRAIALDDDCIYFADADAIWRAPKSGGAPAFLAPTTTYVNIVVVDSSGVYWSETDIDRVQRIAK